MDRNRLPPHPNPLNDGRDIFNRFSVTAAKIGYPIDSINGKARESTHCSLCNVRLSGPLLDTAHPSITIINSYVVTVSSGLDKVKDIMDSFDDKNITAETDADKLYRHDINSIKDALRKLAAKVDGKAIQPKLYQKPMHFCLPICYDLFLNEKNCIMHSALFWMFSYKSICSVMPGNINMPKDVAILIGKWIMKNSLIEDYSMHIVSLKKKIKAKSLQSNDANNFIGQTQAELNSKFQSMLNRQITNK